MIDASAARSRLETRLRELTLRTERIARDLRRPGHPDSAEQATQVENDEVLEGLDVAERAELARVRHALGRLQAGRYDTCEGCGAEIPAARLEALPDTAVCVACA